MQPRRSGATKHQARQHWCPPIPERSFQNTLIILYTFEKVNWMVRQIFQLIKNFIYLTAKQIFQLIKKNGKLIEMSCETHSMPIESGYTLSNKTILL